MSSRGKSRSSQRERYRKEGRNRGIKVQCLMCGARWTQRHGNPSACKSCNGRLVQI